MSARAPLWTRDEVAAATGGRPDGGADAWTASGVSIDSRTCRPGDLFVALAGERFDGHDHVGEALGAGAAAAIVSRGPSAVRAGAPLVRVDDCLAALADLGRAARARGAARVVGVTGSVGKTGTKEAMTLALSALGPTHATEGNLNNHIGVPLTLARMPRDASFAVIEMGMSRAGEISRLARLARPSLAVITTIATVHLEFFEHIAAIADAKAEIFDGMSGEGIAVLNQDNIYFATLAEHAWARGLERIVGFGAHPDAHARLASCALDEEGSEVTARIGPRQVRYRLNMPGRHWVQNSLAVLGAAAALGGDPARAAAALAELAAPRGRGARMTVRLPGGPLSVIDDSYNASPASMRAAFAVLGGATPPSGGRRIAVLGDMLELGGDAAQLHAALAGDLEAAGIERIFCAGPNMAALDAALPGPLRGGRARDSAALAPRVCAAVRPGDVVLVKGSLGSRMRLIVDALGALEGTGAKEADHAV